MKTGTAILIASIAVCLVIGLASSRRGDRRISTTLPIQVTSTATTETMPTLVQPTPVPTVAARLPSTGERVLAGGIALTVVSAATTNQLSSIQKSGKDTIYVLADVLIENIDRDSTPYNPLYFKLKDKEGYEYTAEIFTDRALQSGVLQRGDKSRGYVAFKVRKGSSGLVLSYEPLVLLGGYEVIRIQLN